jgi:calcium-dependent protein kinase
MDPVKIGREAFIGKSESTVMENYDVLRQLGKGGYGKVYRVRHKKTGEVRACKQLSKLNIDDLVKFQREIDILIKADHPNIIKMYEYFESKNNLYLIMEECNGGELFDKIIEHIDNEEMYTEKEAAEIILQVMSAIEYCHNNGICHRDLKPENLLYLKKGDEKDNPLKVIDFGLSQKTDMKKILSSKVGTAYYVSPEILSGKYNEKCDIWSAGVILYVLLSGDPPFNGPSDGVIYSKIKKMKFDFPSSKWKNISKEAKDLLTHMLVPENERYTASQVIAHPWFKNAREMKLEKLNFSSQFFKEYNELNKLQKVVLLFIASRLSENEIKELKDIFTAFDQNKDGQIGFNEFHEGLKKLKSGEKNDQLINSYFSSIDTDKNGKIDYTEFLAACLEKKIFLKEEKLYEAFSVFDKDQDGKITKDELMSVLKLEPKDDAYVKELIKNADKNSDGAIDYKEFLEFMGLKK